jgi:hypothetical protein
MQFSKLNLQGYRDPVSSSVRASQSIDCECLLLQDAKEGLHRRAIARSFPFRVIPSMGTPQGMPLFRIQHLNRPFAGNSTFLDGATISNSIYFPIHLG